MNQNVKTFEKEGFLVEAIEESGCRLNVKVVLQPKAAQKTYQKAVKLVNKQISVPGFRKGHAPDKAVIARHSSYVEQEWKEILVNEAYRAALELTEIYPIGRDSVDKPKIEKCSQEEGAIVHISYEHYPQVPTIDFSKIKLPELKQEAVKEERIEELLEQVRSGLADWEDVTGRPVDEGDYVDITIESIDQDPPQKIVENRRFEVTTTRIPLWLHTLLIGMQVGESSEGLSAVDPEAEESIKKDFKPANMRVTLHGIKNKLLPPIDEALAHKAGAESLEDLRHKIRKKLEKETEIEFQNKKFDALEQALLETHHFDLPASFVEAERTERISRKIQAMKQDNLSDDEIKSQEKEIEKQVAHEIDIALRLYFLNKQLAKQGKISLTNAELNEELSRQFTANPYLYSKNDEAKTKEFVSHIASEMMQRKAKEYALSAIESS